MQSIRDQIQHLTGRISTLDAERAELIGELRKLQEQLQTEPNNSSPILTKSHCTIEEQITIFHSLFRGRMDVFPKRWDSSKTGKAGYSPACQNEWVRGICKKPQIKCSECSNQAFIPLTETIIHKHLMGEGPDAYKRDYTIGVYPMLKDETCWFLAVDLDKEKWQRDASAFLETCRIRNVPASLERSRSGNGGHIWIFFSAPVPASEARKMGAALLTETMERTPEIGFESYDRFFPNQDTMPSGGFGNLIALPLQHRPRENGNSIFLDEYFEPYPDQWEYLASIRRMTLTEIAAIVEEASIKGKILGVRMPLDEEDDKPWEICPSRTRHDIRVFA